MSLEFQSRFLKDFKIISLPTDFDRGGFGSLYKVCPVGVSSKYEEIEDEDDDEISVVKIVELSERKGDKHEGNADNATKALLEVEILKAKDIEHVNIIKVYESWFESPPVGFEYPQRPPVRNTKGLLIIRMEYCNLKSLNNWLGPDSWWGTEPDGWILFYQIALGLEHLHKHGIIHRDIKPANIVLTVDKELNIVIAKIADFGLATEEKSRLSVGVGTPGYKSPEVISSSSYSFKSDVYALGIVFCQILAKVRQNVSNDEFSKRFLNPGGHFIASDLQKKLQELLSHEELNLIELMTCVDPNHRLNSSDVIAKMETLQPEIYNQTITPCKSKPWEYKIIASFPKYKTFRPIEDTTDPNMLTRLILRNIVGDLSEITKCIHNCSNLELIELQFKNTGDLEQKFDKTNRNFLPNLKSLHFYQTNMYPTFQFPITDLQLDNMLLHMSQWQIISNKIIVKARWKDNRLVDINPTLGSFYINGVCTQGFVGYLESTKFKSISMNRLNPRRLPTNHASIAVIEGYQFKSYFEKVENLTIVDIPMGIQKGLVFNKFQYLTDLTFAHFQRSDNDRKPFILSSKDLPPRIRRMHLQSVKIKVIASGTKIELDSLVFEDCSLSEDFFPTYQSTFQVSELFILDNSLIKLDFDILRILFQSSWKLLILDGFTWGIPNEVTNTFVKITVSQIPEYRTIPSNCHFLEFRNIQGQISMRELSTMNYLNMFEAQDLKYITDSDRVLKEGPENVGYFDGFVDGEAPDIFADETEFYFDECKYQTDLVQFKQLKNKNKLTKIVIKNAVINGSLGVLLYGCKKLETLILKNVQLKQNLNMKPYLPELKTFQYLEDFDSSKYQAKIPNFFPEESLASILRFIRSKEVYKKLWTSGLKVSIKFGKYLILKVDNDLGQLFVQHLATSDNLLAEVELNDKLNSLLLYKTSLNANALKNIPEQLVILNISRVSGINFENIFCDFPNLKSLFYEANEEEYSQHVDPDVLAKLDSVETVCIGRVTLSNLPKKVKLKQLTFHNCRLPSNLFVDSASSLNVERFLIIGGEILAPQGSIRDLFQSESKYDWVGIVFYIPVNTKTELVTGSGWVKLDEDFLIENTVMNSKVDLQKHAVFCDDRGMSLMTFVGLHKNSENAWDPCETSGLVSQVNAMTGFQMINDGESNTFDLRSLESVNHFTYGRPVIMY